MLLLPWSLLSTIAELDDRIALIRGNLRDLVEQAAAGHADAGRGHHRVRNQAGHPEYRIGEQQEERPNREQQMAVSPDGLRQPFGDGERDRSGCDP